MYDIEGYDPEIVCAVNDSPENIRTFIGILNRLGLGDTIIDEADDGRSFRVYFSPYLKNPGIVEDRYNGALKEYHIRMLTDLIPDAFSVTDGYDLLGEPNTIAVSCAIQDSHRIRQKLALGMPSDWINQTTQDGLAVFYFKDGNAPALISELLYDKSKPVVPRVLLPA